MRYGNRQRPHLRIVLHGMNERNLSMLRMLFKGPEWQDCEIVGNGAADVGLVDLDTPAPDRDWETFRRRHPELPTVVMSLREQSRGNARYLRKPFDADALRKAIDTLRDDGARALARTAARRAAPPAPDAPAKPAPAPLPEPPAAPPPTTRKAAAAFDHDADERNCGRQPDVDLDAPRASAKFVYDPPRYFQGVLEYAMRQAQERGVPLAIRGLPAPFVVVPGRAPVIVTPLRDSVLRSLCTLAMKPDSLPIDAAADTAADLPRVPADVLLWQVALWTARGRLRRGVGLDAPQRLLHWPDFTRQVATPHAMRLAAILVAGARTPRDLCTTLRLPQRHVFSLLSAAASVGLLERRPAATPAAALPPPAPPVRSLFARILGRLVPGA
jgi:hypothetical protein